MDKSVSCFNKVMNFLLGSSEITEESISEFIKKQENKEIKTCLKVPPLLQKL